MIEEDEIRVDNLIIDDPEVVDYFKDLDEEKREKQIISALKIGTIGLKTSTTTIDVNYVEKEFQKFQNEVEDKFEEICENWDENIEEMFGKNGSFEDDFLDPGEKGTPIYKLKTSIIDEFNNLYEQLGFKAGLEEEKEKGTRKGREFEDTVWEYLADISTNFGDTPEKTGDIPGMADNKKGDITVEINPEETSGVERKIVFEVKNKSVQFGGKGCITNELDGARKNRNAELSVLVINDKYEPSETGPFAKWDNNTYVCTFSEEEDILPLEVAYRAARVDTLKRISKEEIGFDQKKINSLIDELEDKLGLKKTIKGNLTTARNKIDDAEDDVEKMVEEIQYTLSKLEKCLVKE